jgi:hypothetical protein
MLRCTVPYADLARKRLKTSTSGAPSSPQQVAAPVDADADGAARSPRGESPPLSPARPRRLCRDHVWHSDSDDDYKQPSSFDSQDDDSPLEFDGDDLDETPEERGTEIAGEKKRKMTKADLAAMIPDNIIAPWPELRCHLENTPCPKCLGKRLNPNGDAYIEADEGILWRPSLAAESVSWGAITDIIVNCSNQHCQHQMVVMPNNDAFAG